VQHEHLQIRVEAEDGNNYWMTINVRNGNDEVSYYLDEQYQHSITKAIHTANLPQGFTKLNSQPGGIALDYIREQLFPFDKMEDLEKDPGAPYHSLEDMLTTQLVNASRAQDASVYVFGSKFDDGEKYSSYNLAVGIHDIHMNQGSVGAHQGSNGIYQSGALLVNYPKENRWSAVFMKFASQKTVTDNNGNPK